MITSENQEKEFVISTKFKTKIGSYLSWPVGAVELTKAFGDVPQIKGLKLKFLEHYPKHPKGKWPASFCVIEAKYTHHQNVPQLLAGVIDDGWHLDISPVPRQMRAEIRNAIEQRGFGLIAEWFRDHSEYSGREGNLSVAAFWNSETKELTFKARDYVLPEASGVKQRNKK